MAKYEIGAGSRCAVKLQTVYGTAVTPDTLLNMRNESISVAVSKTSEDNLLQNKTTAGVDLESVSVSGGINTYLRPEFADWLFEATLGAKEETSEGSGIYQYTLAEPDDDVNFSTVIMERGTEVKEYADMAISSLTLVCNAQKTVEANINFIGVKEEAGEYPTDEPTLLLKSYKCTNAYLKFGTEQLPVETLSLTIDNGLSEGPRTYLSTIYAEEPSRGTRNVSLQFTLPVEVTSSKGYKNLKAKVESDSYVSLELKFDNGTADENIVIKLPSVALTAANANVGGPQLIDGSISGIAVQSGTSEPIKVTVNHPSQSST